MTFTQTRDQFFERVDHDCSFCPRDEVCLCDTPFCRSCGNDLGVHEHAEGCGNAAGDTCTNTAGCTDCAEGRRVRFFCLLAEDRIEPGLQLRIEGYHFDKEDGPSDHDFTCVVKRGPYRMASYPFSRPALDYDVGVWQVRGASIPWEDLADESVWGNGYEELSVEVLG